MVQAIPDSRVLSSMANGISTRRISPKGAWMSTTMLSIPQVYPSSKLTKTHPRMATNPLNGRSSMRNSSQLRAVQVQAIGNDIVVTYVLHEEGARFETDGPGLGFVDIYSTTGRLLRRLEHGDWLNAPWGIALAPLDFGRFSHDLLIGQFAGGGDTQSSGFIAAYDLTTGKFKGLLQNASGSTLTINGIWALSPGSVNPNNSDTAAAPAAQVYFTAGPNHGSGGLFGYLTPTPGELVEGNDQ